MADRHAEAIAAIEHFWGQTSGGHKDWEALYETLVALKLPQDELRRLRRGLPIPESPGTTAARIARAGQCLDELIG